jgi:hypothetical protein
MSQQKERQAHLITAGYTSFVAEALSENGYTIEDGKLVQYDLDFNGDRCGGAVYAAGNSVDTLLRVVLQWNGIIGYTGSILGAVRNLDAQASKRIAPPVVQVLK